MTTHTVIVHNPSKFKIEVLGYTEYGNKVFTHIAHPRSTSSICYYDEPFSWIRINLEINGQWIKGTAEILASDDSIIYVKQLEENGVKVNFKKCSLTFCDGKCEVTEKTYDNQKIPTSKKRHKID